MSYPARTYTGTITDKVGRVLHRTEGHETRAQAARAALLARPGAKVAGTGWGYHGGSDMQWTHRDGFVRTHGEPLVLDLPA